MQKISRYSKLAEITQLINSKLDLRESLELVVKAISEEILQCDSVGIFLGLPNGTFRGYVSKPDTINGISIDHLVIDPTTDLFARELIEKRKSIYIPDTSKDNRPDLRAVELLKIRSLLGIPIFNNEEIFGLVQLFVYDVPMQLTEEEIQTVEAYVNMAAVAIRNGKLFSLQANLLDQVRNAVVYTDLNGKIIFWNKYAEILYQWKSNEIINKNISDAFVPGSLHQLMQNVLTKVIEVGYWEDEVTHRRKDGTELCVHSVITLVKSSEGMPIGMVGINNDITEKKAIESHIAHLDRLNLIGEMAAGIGHEVRNPLTTVRGFLQLLGRKDTYTEDKEFFDLMIRELDRANSIITEYLSLSKDKMLNIKLQNLNHIINRIIPLLRADALMSDKYIELRLENIPDVPVDEKEINQLIINLVRNGLEVTPPGGRVIIRTYSEDGVVKLSVADQGKGISSDIIDKLGTPFVTTKENGTGLGLAICYSIATRHNATIELDTRPSGTTFFLAFSSN